MKRNFQHLQACLKRQNRGKPSAAQLANERDRDLLKTLVASLVSKWKADDAAEKQTRVKTDRNQNMKTNRKTRALLRSAIAAEQSNGLSYGESFAAVAEREPSLVGVEPQQPPEFGNEAFAGVRERRAKLQAAVSEEMAKTGFGYDLCFTTVCARPEFANTHDRTNDLAGGGGRRTKLRELLVATAARLGLDLNTNYNRVWSITARENPEFFASMIQPAQKPKGVFQKNLYGGPMTAPSPHSGTEGRSRTLDRPDLPGDRLVENPAQRAERMAS